VSVTKYYIGPIGEILHRRHFIFTVVTFKRQKTMLEAKKRLNCDAEVWQLPHNNCVIYYRDRE